MSVRSARRAAGAVLAVFAGTSAEPATALAHGLVARSDLPIPRWLFAWAAAVVLLVSFAALAALWKQPKLEPEVWRKVAPRLGRLLASRAIETLAGAIGVALLGIVIWSGFNGTQATTDNFAPTFVYVIFWVGLVAASVLLGDVFRAFNPWRAIATAISKAGTRLARGPLPAPLEYPARLGRWPAALGILAFAYLELAAGNGAVPRNIAIAAIAYSAVTLIGMSLYGIDTWLDRGEAFSVYFNLFSRVAPFERRGALLGVRRPLSGLASLDASLAGTVPLLAVMIGAVTFDGSTEGSLWPGIRSSLSSFFSQHGLSASGAIRMAGAVGLLSSILIVLALYEIGIAGARHWGGSRQSDDIGSAFAHSLVPIGVAYVGAHYLTFLLTQGQAILPLASDPLGHGWNLFGTANRVVDYGVIGVTTTWYLQVLLVVSGHVAGLTAAHDRALVLYRDTRLAMRSQYWMLGVMVCFTFLALFLLAQAGV